MEKPIPEGNAPEVINPKPFSGLLFDHKETAEYILDAYGPGEQPIGYIDENGEIETVYLPPAWLRPSDTYLDPIEGDEWGPEYPWANCPEGWENWGRDPDTDDDAWDMPDYWWGE